MSNHIIFNSEANTTTFQQPGENSPVSKRRRIMAVDEGEFPFSEQDLVIMSVIQKASSFYIPGLYQEKLRQKRCKEWTDLLQGTKPDASPEAQIQAARSLAVLTNQFYSFYLNKPALNQNDFKAKRKWEIVNKAIEPEAKDNRQRAAIVELKSLLQSRESQEKHWSQIGFSDLPFSEVGEFYQPTDSPPPCLSPSEFPFSPDTLAAINEPIDFQSLFSGLSPSQFPVSTLMVDKFTPSLFVDSSSTTALELPPATFEVMETAESQSSSCVTLGPVQFSQLEEEMSHGQSYFTHARYQEGSQYGFASQSSSSHNLKGLSAADAEGAKVDPGMLAVIQMASQYQREYKKIDIPQKWRWGGVSEGIVVGASGEKQSNAAESLIALTRSIYSPTMQGKSGQNELWKAVYEGIAGYASQEEQIKAVTALTTLLENRRKPAQSNPVPQHQRIVAVHSNLQPPKTNPKFCLEEPVASNTYLTMLSIIKKASKFYLPYPDHQLNLEQRGLQQPYWTALLQAIESNASQKEEIEEIQMHAAESLAILTNAFRSSYARKFIETGKEGRTHTTYRLQWEAVDKAITPNAAEDIQRAAIPKLQSLVNWKQTKIRYDKKQTVSEENKEKKLAVVKTTGTVGSENSIENEEIIFPLDEKKRINMLSIIQKASQCDVERCPGNLKESYNITLQKKRWDAVFRGIASGALEEGVLKEAAESLISLKKSMYPRYSKEDLPSLRKRGLWEAISRGIAPKAPGDQLEAVDAFAKLFENRIKDVRRNTKNKQIVIEKSTTRTAPAPIIPLPPEILAHSDSPAANTPVSLQPLEMFVEEYPSTEIGTVANTFQESLVEDFLSGTFLSTSPSALLEIPDDLFNGY